MRKVFISHATEDDGFVRELDQALRLLDEDVWIDSRELRGGDPLWPEIQQAIMDASAYVVVVSPAALQSKWVGMELTCALQVQKQRGKEKFPVIPLSLNGTRLGVLEAFFDTEPLYIPVSSTAGGVDAALHAILVALGKRLPTDPPEFPQPPAMPLEELVLELGDLKFQEEGGKRRAFGRARLVYEPAMPGQETVKSTQDWLIVAPLGPIEAEELRWYLEKYAIWPSEIFRNRAAQVERQLIGWGRALHDAALPPASTANVLQAWARIDERAGRRFSVYIDTRPIAGMAETDITLAREAATALLGLPWELLHDGSSFLFQGAQPTRVRRRLPNTQGRSVPVVAPPIRILLITARPEDEACGYIDHRASALPLVEAVEALGGLVQLHILSPATLPALRKELDRARQAGTPYHVVHFDGHGVYNRQVGLGGLCFEKPEDEARLERRGHSTVYTDVLGPLLKGHRIPLVFLEACQSALAEAATDSVATALLQEGVASVVAMSHSVLVETARRFVAQFYHALAQGERIGSAMLAGQRHLKDDTLRGRIFGAGDLRLEDWFVPVLFQEKNDPQLFQRLPTPQTRDDFLARRKALLGALPPEPATGFVGRSRELLALERLLRRQRYAVIRGQGGEGKTALAAEFARWWVRSQQIQRAVFVSVDLLQSLGKHRLMERVTQARDRAVAHLDGLWNHARFDAQRTRIEQQLAIRHLHEALAGAQDLLQRARQAGELAYSNVDYDLACACFLLARVLLTADDAEQALPLLDEAQQRFEAVERRQPGCGAARMASICFSERGNCFLNLRRLEDAASAYEESIRRAEQRDDERSVAVGKAQLGTVRLEQKRYSEALAAYAATRADFTRLGEPDSVAMSWHQTGMVLEETGPPQAAEDAYRQALAIMVPQGNIAGQAVTLGQLGILYDNVLGRTEEAVAFFRQAADKYGKTKNTANEGRTRSNLAIALLKLQRHDEARQAIERAIQCREGLGHAAEPWKSWDILADIETATHNPNAAAVAQKKAIASYLAYRRDGGENHDGPGRLSLAISQALHANKPDEASTLLRQLAAEPQATRLQPFIQALQALLAGSRDPALADAQGLDFSMAAEILWLIETLPRPA